jgi:uncharacterized phage protein gp47/JayE
MAGLTRDGFLPKTYEEIQTSIKARLEVFNEGFDFSPTSPDGQLIDIMSLELSLAWSELSLVYKSYNPNEAIGAGLRNLGLITGLPRGAATRSQAFVNLEGVADTVVPKGSVVTDDDGNEFRTVIDAIIPTTVSVVADVSGPIVVDIGTINTIKSPIEGWTNVSQPTIGSKGKPAQSEVAYKNERNRTVLRNFTSVSEVIQSRLFELGIEQADIQNNDSPTDALADGTPPNTIHVTVGEVGDITDEQIGQVILDTKGLGCPTFGNTTVTVNDRLGHTHEVKFSKADGVAIFVILDVTFLDTDVAGAIEGIRNDLSTHINGLLSGEDVVWSRLFGVITPYAKAQVNSLTIGRKADLSDQAAANVSISATEYAQTEIGLISITET